MIQVDGHVPGTSQIRSDVFYLATIVLLIALLYRNAIHGEFIWDDRAAVVKNEDVHGSNPISLLLWHDFWGQDISLPTSHKSYRPLTVLTYRLDFLVYGLDAYGYHITNIVVYCFSCIVLYLAAKLWIQQQAARIGVFLFAIHPIHVEAVTSIVGRADCLCGLFYVLAMGSYTLAIRPPMTMTTTKATSNGRLHALYQVLLFVGAYLSAALTTLSKEIGFTVLGVFITIEVLEEMKAMVAKVGEGGRVRGVALFLRSLTACLTRWWSLLRIIALISIAIAYLYLRRMLHGPHTMLYQWTLMENHVSSMPSLLQRSMAYAQYHFWYCWKLLLPTHLCFDYGYRCVSDVESLWDISNLLPLGLYLILAWTVWKCIDRVKVAMLMGLAMMVIPIIPALNIFLPVGTLLAERLLFIPSMGYCMLVAQLLAVDLHPYLDKGSEGLTLWLDAVIGRIARWLPRVRRHKDTPRQVPLELLIKPLDGRLTGEAPSAVASADPAVIMDSNSDKKKVRFDLTKNKGKPIDKLKSKQSRVAKQQHSTTIQDKLKQTNPTDPSYTHPMVAMETCPSLHRSSPSSSSSSAALIQVNLVHLVMTTLLFCCGWKIIVRNTDWRDELSLFRSGLAVCPSSLKVLSNYALLSIAHGQTRIGLEAALKAISIYPQQVAAVTNAGVAYHRLGEYPRSIAMYRRGLELDPMNHKILGYLGQAYFSWSNTIVGDSAVSALRHEALDNLMTAVRLGFHAPSMLHMIGTILLDLGRLIEAIDYYDSAIKRSMQLRAYYRHSRDVPLEDDIDVAATYNQLGQAYMALSNHTMAINAFKEGLKLQPHNIPILSNLGNIYREVGEVDLARQTMRMGIERSGEVVPAALLNNLGLLELETGRYNEALALFEEALSRYQLSSSSDASASSTSHGSSHAKAISPDGSSVVVVMRRNIERAKALLASRR